MPQLRPRLLAVLTLAAFLAILFGMPAAAQTFNSGSNGSDGALDFSAVPAGTTVDFDPTSYNPPLDPDHDNVYHFTTIVIPTGVTVRLSSDRLGGAPVLWLASGAVQIAGTLDLSGKNGNPGSGVPLPSLAGAGGYGGGAGGTREQTFQPGNGLGGGRGAGGAAGHAIEGPGSNIAASYGNDFLLPLLGGSGGAGGVYDGNFSTNGGSGGAGGGAILLASSTSITISGNILVNGGLGGCPAGSQQPFYVGGGGSGGAIRLMAPLVQGTGSLNALGGAGCSSNAGYHGSYGRIRLEAFQQRFTGSIQPIPFFVTPGSVFPPANAPLVRVVRVAGAAVPAEPTGSFLNPDVTLSGVSTATLDIEARKIPPGTVVKLTLTPETGSAVTVNSSPLAGTLDLSTATATVTIPSGFSRFTVQANWTP